MPIVAFFPWLVGLFSSILTTLFTWFVTQFAARRAFRFALVTTFLIAAATMTVTVAATIKALIMQIQVSMPGGLGEATYFLPSNINTVIAIYFSMRVSFYLYNWMTFVISAYVEGLPGHTP